MAREDLAGLRDLTEEYPWFAGAHLLRSMAEHVQGELTSGSGVQQAAAHLPSREVLYELLHGPGQTMPVAALEAPAETMPPPKAEPVVAPLPEPEPVETQAAASTEVIPPPEEAVAQADGPAAAAHGMPVAEVPDPALDILEQQMLEAAIASSYAIRQEVMLAEVPPPTPPAAPPPPVEALPPAPEPILALEEPENTPRAVPVRGRMRFTEWLEVPATAVVNDPAPKLQEAKEDAATPETPVSKAEPLDVGTLVDRFIRSQHPEPRPKAEFFTPQQAAKRSLEEHSGMVTETLAKIYEQQGRLDKAMEAYRKLALKYPEKSAYFAALEKGLQARQNK